MKRRAETDKLEHRLLAIGRSIQSQFAKRGFASILFGVLFGLYALFIIDYITDIPYVIRIALTIIGLLYAMYYLNTRYLKKGRVQLSAQDVSKKVENQNPFLQSRVISMLQFQGAKQLPSGISENLVEGMLDQAIDQLRDVNLQEVIDRSWIKKHFKRISLIALIIAATAAFAPTYMLAFVQRFIDPSAQYPTRTQIVDVSVNDIIPAGDNFDITVKAEGELPELGKITIYTESTGNVEFELTKSKVDGVYVAHISSINEVAEMTIQLGDDSHGPQTVTPTPRPSLKSITATIKSPTYTKLEDQTEKTGNIRVIKGSIITIHIEANKALAQLNVNSSTKDFIPPKAESTDGINWSMKIEAENSFSYQISMLDKAGLESSNNASYQVSVMTDRPPVIRITSPKAGSELAAVSKMPLRFKVNDDIGIDKVAIKYLVIPANSTEAAQDINYDNAKTMSNIEGIDNKSFDFDDLWDNTKIELRSGDTIYLWVEANDKSPEQHVQRSSDRQITIISIEEYRNKLIQKLSENVGKVDEPIINLKDSARKLGQ